MNMASTFVETVREAADSRETDDETSPHGIDPEEWDGN